MKQRTAKGQAPKSHKKKRSVLYKWILSYLLILIIPMVGAFFTYRYTYSVVRQEIFASNRMALSSMMTGVEDAFSQMKSIAESCLISDTMRTALDAQESPSLFREALPDLIKTLYSLQFSLPGMEIVAYLPTQEYIVTADTANPLANIASAIRLIRNSSLNEAEYIASMREISLQGVFTYSGNYSYKHNGEPVITHIRSYNQVSPRNALKYATVFVMMPVERLFGQYGDADSLVLAYDAAGDLLFFSGEAQKTEDIATLLAPNEQGMLTYMLDGERYLGCQLHSETCDWTFVLLTQESRFWRNADYMATVFLFTLAVVLLMGILLTVALVRKNYRPLSQTIASIAPGHVGDEENEFDLIRNTFLALMHEHRDVKRTLYVQQELFRDNYLFSHLHGSREALSDADIQAFLQLDFQGKSFVIISFFVSGEESLTIDTALVEAAGDQDAVSFLIDSYFSRLFLDRYIGYRLPMEQVRTWLLVLSAGQEEDFATEASEKLEECMRRLKKALGAPVSAFMSDVLREFEDLPDAYRAILDSTEYQYISGSEGIVRVSRRDKNVREMRRRRQEEEEIELLGEAICAGRANDAQAVLGRLLAQEEKLSVEEPWEQRLRIYGWIGMLLRIEGVCNRVPPSKLHKQLAELIAAPSPKERLEALVSRLCGSSTQEGEADDRLSTRVQAYVKENFADCNLSLRSIADVFGISPKYLSRLYHSETGNSLLDYINLVRIQHALELLRDEANTVSHVAEMVGYTNVKTFRRAFFRIEGAMPSQFRE